MHFSSYPGQFSSVDDFYVVKHTNTAGDVINLAILETTYGVKDDTLYDDVIIPVNAEGKAVLTWLRVMAATLGAADAVSWKN